MGESFKPILLWCSLILREFFGWEYSMTESKCKLILREYIGREYSMNESNCFLTGPGERVGGGGGGGGGGGLERWNSFTWRIKVVPAEQNWVFSVFMFTNYCRIQLVTVLTVSA